MRSKIVRFLLGQAVYSITLLGTTVLGTTFQLGTFAEPLASGERLASLVFRLRQFSALAPRASRSSKDSGLYLYFRIRHSLTHLRPVILSADWSISRLQSWTCSSLPTVAEFVKLTQSIVIEIQRQSADLYKVQLCNRQFFCGVHSGLRGKGIRVSPAWLVPVSLEPSL